MSHSNLEYCKNCKGLHEHDEDGQLLDSCLYGRSRFSPIEAEKLIDELAAQLAARAGKMGNGSNAINKRRGGVTENKGDA
jgi:hypothetical protein